jgi:hypothetical protein
LKTISLTKLKFLCNQKGKVTDNWGGQVIQKLDNPSKAKQIKLPETKQMLNTT